MLTRRSLLAAASATAALGGSAFGFSKQLFAAESAAGELSPGVPSGIASYATMATLPGKKPLIRLSDRGPNYEAPLEYFRTPITPNDEFFVRYHLSNIPEVDAKTYKIEVGGEGANGQTELTLRRSQEDAGGGTGGGQSMLRQPARPVQSACRRRRVGLRRHGLRALEGRPPQGRARYGRPEKRGDRDRIQRRRQPDLRQDAGFHQEPAGVEGDR